MPFLIKPVENKANKKGISFFSNKLSVFLIEKYRNKQREKLKTVPKKEKEKSKTNNEKIDSIKNRSLFL